MSEAIRDENRVKSLLATSNVDGSTPVLVKVDPVQGVLSVDDASTGSDLSGAIANRDANRVAVLLGVSSDDGETPVPVYADPATGALLIDSN